MTTRCFPSSCPFECAVDAHTWGEAHCGFRVGARPRGAASMLFGVRDNCACAWGVIASVWRPGRARLPRYEDKATLARDRGAACSPRHATPRSGAAVGAWALASAGGSAAGMSVGVGGAWAARERPRIGTMFKIGAINMETHRSRRLADILASTRHLSTFRQYLA